RDLRAWVMDARRRVAAARAPAAARVRLSGALVSLLRGHFGRGGDHGSPAELRACPRRAGGALRGAQSRRPHHLPILRALPGAAAWPGGLPRLALSREPRGGAGGAAA